MNIQTLIRALVIIAMAALITATATGAVLVQTQLAGTISERGRTNTNGFYGTNGFFYRAPSQNVKSRTTINPILGTFAFPIAPIML